MKKVYHCRVPDGSHLLKFLTGQYHNLLIYYISSTPASPRGSCLRLALVMASAAARREAGNKAFTAIDIEESHVLRSNRRQLPRAHERVWIYHSIINSFHRR